MTNRRKSATFYASIACVSTLVSGCAQLTTYNHSRIVKPNVVEQTFIDAKQRVIVTVPGANPDGSAFIRFCAEPSPDALSALAAAGNGGLTAAEKASLQAAFSFSETASNIGLRTQSIQLMRDAMYRICEGVASGVLTSGQFETLHRRFQNSMVAILAIEQLTGVVKPAGAQLSTSSGIGAAKEIAAFSENAAKAQEASIAADADAKTKAKALTDAQDKAKAYLTTAGVAEDALTSDQQKSYAPLKESVTKATAAKAAADTTAAAANDKLAIYQTGMNAVGGGNMATSGTATLTGGTGGPIDAAAATAIAEAVSAIVSEELDIGFLREACATLFVAEIEGRSKVPLGTGFSKTCHDYAQEDIGRTTAYNKLMASYAANIDMLTKQGKAAPSAAEAIAAAPKPHPLIVKKTLRLKPRDMTPQ